MMLKFYRLLWVPPTHDVEVLQTVVGPPTHDVEVLQTVVGSPRLMMLKFLHCCGSPRLMMLKFYRLLWVPSCCGFSPVVGSLLTHRVEAKCQQILPQSFSLLNPL